jgi:hypothetical protein
MSLEAAEQKQGHMRWSRPELSSDALTRTCVQAALSVDLFAFCMARMRLPWCKLWFLVPYSAIVRA